MGRSGVFYKILGQFWIVVPSQHHHLSTATAAEHLLKSWTAPWAWAHENFIETTIFRLLKHNLTVILACGFHMNGG